MNHTIRVNIDAIRNDQLQQKPKCLTILRHRCGQPSSAFVLLTWFHRMADRRQQLNLSLVYITFTRAFGELFFITFNLN